MKFGAHVSIAGGVFNAPENGKKSTCDVVQIFTKNQMQWRVPELRGEDIARFKAEVARTGIQAVCVHASYLINLGSFDSHKLQQSRANFVVELQRAEALDIPFLVVHPGSHAGHGVEQGTKAVAESLNHTLDLCRKDKVKILLEITAGQGDNLGFTFEQLNEIMVRVEARERVGVCLDTCHLFAAGYELRTAEGYRETIQQLEDIIGVKKVGVIHCNDSKRELGSRVDRHDHIGEGKLGLEAFRHFVQDPRFQNVPMIIETPGGPAKDAENLKKLRALANEPA